MPPHSLLVSSMLRSRRTTLLLSAEILETVCSNNPICAINHVSLFYFYLANQFFALNIGC